MTMLHAKAVHDAIARGRRWQFVCLFSLASLLTACSGAPAGSSPPSTPAPTASSAVSASPVTATASAASLASPAPGIRLSSVFPPHASFQVPSGWTLHEDSIGTFVLFAPSVQTSADGSVSAIYALNHAMVHPAGCGIPVDPHQDAKHMTATLVGLPGLIASKPKAIELASRSGYVVEVHVVPTWKEGCIGTTPGVELLHSLPPTSDPSFDDGIGVGTSTAMYLLDRPEGGVMTIEVDDQSGGHDLAAYRAVAETMQFGP